ncbi:MAG: hypothetical protein AAB925_00560 [Patescibacteria group bacterium]
MAINKKVIFISLFCILLIWCIITTALSIYSMRQISRFNQTSQINTKILSFANIFIEKILMSKEDVNFDTRLELETMVRNLNDQEIFDKWQKFTKSKTEEEAGENAKALLSSLIQKISY